MSSPDRQLQDRPRFGLPVKELTEKRFTDIVHFYDIITGGWGSDHLKIDCACLKDTRNFIKKGFCAGYRYNSLLNDCSKMWVRRGIPKEGNKIIAYIDFDPATGRPHDGEPQWVTDERTKGDKMASDLYKTVDQYLQEQGIAVELMI